MFTHLKRNWSWVSRGDSRKSLTKKDTLEDDTDLPASKKAKFSVVSNDLVKKKGAKRKLPDDDDEVETRYAHLTISGFVLNENVYLDKHFKICHIFGIKKTQIVFISFFILSYFRLPLH